MGTMTIGLAARGFTVLRATSWAIEAGSYRDYCMSDLMTPGQEATPKRNGLQIRACPGFEPGGSGLITALCVPRRI